MTTTLSDYSNSAAIMDKKPLPGDERQEQYPQLIYDPIRRDVEKYLEEQSPALALSVSKIGVHRLPDDSGYGGVFLAAGNPFRYVMTGRGFKCRPAADFDKAQAALDSMMSAEQRRSLVVRRQESQKDMKVLLDLGKSLKRDARAFRRDTATIVVQKALPQSGKEVPVKQAKKPGGAATKKQGKNSVRYNYPQEQQKPKPPAQQVQTGQPTPTPDPVPQPYVDPNKLANVLRMDVGQLKQLAMKFQASPKMSGRKAFINWCTSQLKNLARKHDLDGKYFGLVYDALVQTTNNVPGPQGG